MFEKQYYGYWHEKLSQLVEEKNIGKKVIDPETSQLLIREDVFNNFINSFKQKKPEVIMENYKMLEKYIRLADNLDSQVEKLKRIYDTSGINPYFIKQLGKVYEYMTKEEKEYIPIFNKYKDMYLSKKNIKKGISFLCPELNKRTGGIMEGTICTICGGPGSMKTTLAMNIAYAAVKEGKNICYITLEETPMALYSKLLSRVTLDSMPNNKIPAINIVNNKLSEEEKKQLFNNAEVYLNKLPGKFHIIGESDITSYDTSSIEKVLIKVDKNIRENTDHGIDLLIVDHIQLLKYANTDKDEMSLINSYVSFFRKMSLSFLGTKKEISVILLSQVNREGISYAQRHDGGYKIQHVAEASEIERASTYIISVYTDPMTQLSKLLKVGAVKLRGSSLPLSTINVFADGEYYQVGDTEMPELTDYSSVDLGLDISTTTNNMSTSTESNESLDEILGGLI